MNQGSFQYDLDEVCKENALISSDALDISIEHFF